ncbi:amino acid adenylation domain-containing protein [Micromonospora sp. DT229]|uniref:amino acid adenylation domain-containing protein n=1 Tax=Micromonospora sp. DT229 TaxID=3393430 RepID=UPI003CEFCF0E
MTATFDPRRHGIHLLGRPEVIADPTGYFDAVAELGPLFFDTVARVWVCSGYAETAEILSDHRRFRSARIHSAQTLTSRGLSEFAGVGGMLLEQMIFMDPPDQVEIRAAVRDQFAPSRVRQRDPELRDIATAMVEALPERGEVDLVEEFAQRLHVALAETLLAVTGQPQRLVAWADAYGRLIGSLSTLPNLRDRAVLPVLDEAMAYFRAEARRRLTEPGPDLVSSLAQALAGRPRKSDRDTEYGLETVAANCVVFTAGGYQTLTHLVCTGLLHLAAHPDQQALLRNRPELIDQAVDEFMRIDGSSQYLARQVAEDLELAGVALRAGQSVVVLPGAANLDPRRFTDPRKLDITRQQGRHLGFGMGRHHCIGAPYAERLAGWAILAFLDRFPHYRLADRADAVQWGPHVNTRCPAHAWTMLHPADEQVPAVGADLDRHPRPEPVTRITADPQPSGCPVTAVAPVNPIASVPAVTPASAVELVPAVAPVDPVQQVTPVAPATPGQTADPWYEQLVTWNDTAAPLGTRRLWHEVFAHRAGLDPEAVAVLDRGVPHTYREVEERANALARELRTRGVEPESVVGVVLDRSVELLIATLAVGKAGGAFLLAEHTCPPERLRVMLQEASVGIVLTDPVSAARLAARQLATDLLVVPDTGRAPTAPVTGVAPGNTAYVVFTSGTTGKPKAIAISHEAMVNLHLAQRRVFGIRPSDRVLQFLSPNFDGCVFDLTMAALGGAVLVTVPLTELTVGPPLLRTMRRYGITVATLTPSVWAALAPDPLPDLRIAAAAGERLPTGVLRRWAAPGRRFLNLYGPAETAVWATWHECDPAEEEPPIGRPVPNKRVYVLDEALRPVPVGQPGELCIGGLGVGRYLGQPELMEQRFRPDPFDTRPGRLIYRTGDICRWRPEGTLEYLGRRDRQAKIRGQRVELDEVERILQDAPGVLQCSVVERDGQLTALVVLDVSAGGRDAVRGRQEEITAHLASRLHSAMIPSRFEFLDELPRTLTGKTGHGSTEQRDAAVREPLPPTAVNPPAPPSPAAPAPAPPSPAPPPVPTPAVPAPAVSTPTSPAAVPPLTDQQTFTRLTRLTWRIARIFATSLQVPQHRIRADSDFYSLGGDSLASAELLAALEAEAGLLLDVEDLLIKPTPEGIATQLISRPRIGAPT